VAGVSGWLLVDRHTHRIAKVPQGVADAQRFVMRADQIWAMYCPQRGPDSLIYAASWTWVLEALSRTTDCPHETLFHDVWQAEHTEEPS
jgi:hypothetical protein